MAMHTMADLKMRQALPLSMKVAMSKTRIREWVNYYGEDGVYISFSGGKDSTVLVDLVDETFPNNNIPLVFVDTGLEYPEIREFVKGYGDRVVWLKPEMQFKKVIEEYGYPLISKDVSQALYDIRKQAERNECEPRQTNMWKRGFDRESDYCQKYPSFCRARYDFMIDIPVKVTHMCCNIMKKNPSKKYEKESGRVAMLATMASESRLRQTVWLQEGCNAFDVKRPLSKPMSTWTEQDVLLYIKTKNLPICSVYGDIIEDYEKVGQLEGQMNLLDFGDYDIETPPLKTTGCSRTGCMFCAFGCTTPEWDSFQRMSVTHPKQHEWMLKPWDEGGLGYKEVFDWMNEHGHLNIKY